MPARQSKDSDAVQAKDLGSDKAAEVGSSEVPVDKYPERSYWDALTDEHRKVLEEAGQLPPKPDNS